MPLSNCRHDLDFGYVAHQVDTLRLSALRSDNRRRQFRTQVVPNLEAELGSFQSLEERFSFRDQGGRPFRRAISLGVCQVNNFST